MWNSGSQRQILPSVSNYATVSAVCDFNSTVRGSQNGTPRAYNTSVMPPDPASWLLDSGSSHHITSDLANLALHSPYRGSEEVLVGNGEGLQITHTGSLSLPHSSLSLKNVLTVPEIARV